MEEIFDDKAGEEAWLEQEANIMRVKRLRYLGYSDEEIRKIKSGEEADKIIEKEKKINRLMQGRTEKLAFLRRFHKNVRRG